MKKQHQHAIYNLGTLYCVNLGLNLVYSGIKYTEQNWVRFNMQHYPLQNRKEEVQKQENTNIKNTVSTNKEK